MPPLASTVREPHIRARYGFQEYGYCDGIMQRWSFGQAVDLAVGMGEKQEEVMKHLAQILRRHRRLREARPCQQRLLDLSRRQDLMGEIQRYQRRLRRKCAVGKDGFRGFGIALLEQSVPLAKYQTLGVVLT